MSDEILIILFLLLLIALPAIFSKPNKCPRSQEGYDCQEKTCDHSTEAMRKAKLAMSNKSLIRKR